MNVNIEEMLSNGKTKEEILAEISEAIDDVEDEKADMKAIKDSRRNVAEKLMSHLRLCNAIPEDFADDPAEMERMVDLIEELENDLIDSRFMIDMLRGLGETTAPTKSKSRNEKLSLDELEKIKNDVDAAANTATPAGEKAGYAEMTRQMLTGDYDADKVIAAFKKTL